MKAIEPDLLCLGKGITGGYLPLAATLASEEIFAAFLAPYEQFARVLPRPYLHRQSARRAVALANLDVFEREHVVARVQERSRQLAGLLAELGDRVPHVGDIRQWGLMVGIELVRDRSQPCALRSRENDRRAASFARRAAAASSCARSATSSS